MEKQQHRLTQWAYVVNEKSELSLVFFHDTLPYKIHILQILQV